MQRPHKRLALVVVVAAAGLTPALAMGAAAAAQPAPRATTTATTSTTPDPTASQIKAALKQAESSSQLWATINMCNTDSDKVGIRGEMPSLAFDSKLEMVVRVEEYSATQHRYVPVRGSYTLGGKVFGPDASVQEGITLRFSGSVTMIGRVTFEWLEGDKLLGSVTRSTTGTHNNDAGIPRGYSVGTCSTA